MPYTLGTVTKEDFARGFGMHAFAAPVGGMPKFRHPHSHFHKRTTTSDEGSQPASKSSSSSSPAVASRSNSNNAATDPKKNDEIRLPHGSTAFGSQSQTKSRKQSTAGAIITSGAKSLSDKLNPTYSYGANKSQADSNLSKATPRLVSVVVKPTQQPDLPTAQPHCAAKPVAATAMKTGMKNLTAALNPTYNYGKDQNASANAQQQSRPRRTGRRTTSLFMGSISKSATVGA